MTTLATLTITPGDEGDGAGLLREMGSVLRESRKQRGLLQTEVEGISQRTISDVERGQNGKLTTIMRYAHALELSFYDVVRRATVAIAIRNAPI